jgi:hypothetical protein
MRRTKLISLLRVTVYAQLSTFTRNLASYMRNYNCAQSGILRIDVLFCAQGLRRKDPSPVLAVDIDLGRLPG